MMKKWKETQEEISPKSGREEYEMSINGQRLHFIEVCLLFSIRNQLHRTKKANSQQVYTEKHAELQSQTIQNKDAAPVQLFSSWNESHQNRENREQIMQ